jgi:hypothetical protein
MAEIARDETGAEGWSRSPGQFALPTSGERGSAELLTG